MSDDKPKPSFINDVVKPGLGKVSLGDFDYEGAPAGKQEDNKQYLNGDFKLSPQMAKNMTRFGQEFIDEAAKHHVDLAQTPEFSKFAHKGRDGKMHISPEEVGAAAMASTMTTEAENETQITNAGGLRNDVKVTSQFHDQVTVKGIEKLGKEDAKLAVEIARQLLHDSGLVPKDIDKSYQNALPDPQFTNMASNDPNTNKMRC